jgi:hypothetical protein
MKIPIAGSDYSRAWNYAASVIKVSAGSMHDRHNPVAVRSFLTALNDFRFTGG